MVQLLLQLSFFPSSFAAKEANGDVKHVEGALLSMCGDVSLGPDELPLSSEHATVAQLWCVGEFKAAKKSLKSQKKKLQKTEELVMQPSVLFFLDGIIWGELEQEEKQLKAWRQALLLNPELQWPELWFTTEEPERGALYEQWWDLFLVLRSERLSQNKIDPGWPEDFGNAIFFLDGQELTEDERLYSGEHILQIQCPEDPLVTFRLSFPLDEPQQWLSYCPSGVKPSAASSSNELDDFAPFTVEVQEAETQELETSGGVTETTEPIEDPKGILSEEIKETVQEEKQERIVPPVEEVAELKPYVEKYPMVDQVKVVKVDSRRDLLPLQVGMMIGGTALLTAGTSWTFGVVRPLYLELLAVEPTEITRAEADQQSENFTQAQFQAKAMLLAGTTLLVGGGTLSLISVSQGAVFLQSRVFYF